MLSMVDWTGLRQLRSGGSDGLIEGLAHYRLICGKLFLRVQERMANFHLSHGGSTP